MTELAASLLNRLHDLVGSTTQTLLTGSPLGAGGGSGYQQQGLLSLGNGQSLAVPLTVQNPQVFSTFIQEEKTFLSLVMMRIID
jgi:hypothetical protein